MSGRLVLRGGVVVTGPNGPGATAIGVADGAIAFVGTESESDRWVGTGHGSPEVVDLDGALVTPAFADSHVHTVRTGMALTGLDLTGSPSLEACLDALAAYAAVEPGRGVLIGQGWDETEWRTARPPTAAEVERAAPGQRVCLTRVDAHSSVVSPALASLVPGLEQLDGWSAEGRVERDAHHAVRNALETLVTDEDRLAAARAAVSAMAAVGIVAFHENAAPHIGPESEIPLVRQAAEEAGLHAVVYWGELTSDAEQAAALARRLGVPGLAGDLVADGAFGSRTAALGSAYADAPQTCGHGYVTATQVRDHVVACSEAGLQAGFHVIGDAALEEVATGLEEAARLVGDRLCHLRLEHVELPSPRVLDVLEGLGVIASVQPMFDALWGGPHGMYAARLGARWSDSSPFARLGQHGRIAFGSDSPVTALGPWAAIRAAVHHHEPRHAMSPEAAFAAHTSGGWLAAGADAGTGTLSIGAPAHLAVWRAAGGLDAQHLPVLAPDVPLPELVRLVSSGSTVHQGVVA